MSAKVVRGYPAMAEVVFHVASDPDRWGRWLPAGMRAEPVGERELRLGGPWSGTLTVVDEPAGASTVRLDVDGDADARSAAERALAHLVDEVDDHQNPG